jgi:TetR/AcrR family transcriptional regulator, transcriptional repressor for nem operon
VIDAPATEHGRQTRERILDAAAELIAERGADGTSLDDVRAATSASKSQLYHYFGDKRGLVHAVIDRQCERVIGLQAGLLGRVQDWTDLRDWAGAIVTCIEAQDFRGGCPLGTLAAALSDTDEAARERLASAFGVWRDGIASALRRLVDNGHLDPAADLESLTTATLAAVQGGLLLAKTERRSATLRVALDAVLQQLESHARPEPAACRSITER